MDLASVKRETEKWINSNKSCLKLITVDESVGCLNFVYSSSPVAVSFFLVCPKESDGRKDWVVSSEQEETLPMLHSVQDCLSGGRQRGIEDVLKLITTSLTDSLKNDDNDEEDMGSSEEEDDTDFYYPDEDDVTEDISPVAGPVDPSEEETADDFITGTGSPIAIQRLLQDLKNLKKNGTSYGIAGTPKNDNLFLWNAVDVLQEVQLADLPLDTRLGKDVQDYAKRYKREPVIQLEMKFPSDYPMSPPFVRVLRPRFKFLTGHVTIGGSICMEMLTKSGWMPTNDIEGILIQIRCEILSDPKASLDTHPDREYDEKEAQIAFERMTQKYGWNR